MNQVEIPEAFEHNGYQYRVEFAIADGLAAVSLTEIDRSEKGPILFRYKFTRDGLENNPIMPQGIYDDSIQEPLKIFLIRYINIIT